MYLPESDGHFSGGVMGDQKQQVQAITQKLRIVFRTIQSHSKKSENQCGLSSAKLWMLSEIAARQGIKVSQLATALSIHPSTCSNMLDKLEETGLVMRDRSRTDQRSVHLYVTEQGTALLQQAPKPAQGKLSVALNNLNEEQLRELESGLENLLNALNVSDQKDAFVPIMGE